MIEEKELEPKSPMTSIVNGNKRRVGSGEDEHPIKEAMEIWSRLRGALELAVKTIIITISCETFEQFMLCEGGLKMKR